MMLAFGARVRSITGRLGTVGALLAERPDCPEIVTHAVIRWDDEKSSIVPVQDVELASAPPSSSW